MGINLNGAGRRNGAVNGVVNGAITGGPIVAPGAIPNVTAPSPTPPTTDGGRIRLAPGITDKLKTDPALDVPGMPPMYGEFAFPHTMTMQGLVSTISRAYRMSDEALKNSLENARFMELDVGLRECVEARMRSVALLKWHLEPDDENSVEQRDLCAALTKIIENTPRFMQFRETLLRAVWYGRYAAALEFGWVDARGIAANVPSVLAVNRWRPVHGDKLVFRLDDGKLTHDPDQVGVLVGYTEGERPGGWDDIEIVDRGRAYFLKPYERRGLVIHQHQMEDAAFEDISSAGNIHGVGLRSRLYWEWVQKQETLRWMMEYLERSAFGLDLWFYPEGNSGYLAQAKTAANDRIGPFRNQIFVPVPNDGSGNNYGVQHVETGMAGVTAIQELVTKYFGHRFKRLILGQTLTSESEGGGLGSDGIARVHLGTFKDIVTYDATNLEETITREYVWPLKDFNFPGSSHFRVRFKLETEEIDSDQRLSQIQLAWQMGARISEREVLESVNLTVPGDDDRTLMNPQMSDQPPAPGEAGHLPRDGGHGDQMAAKMRSELAGAGALGESAFDKPREGGAGDGKGSGGGGAMGGAFDE